MSQSVHIDFAAVPEDHEVEQFAQQWAAALDGETRPVEQFGPFVQVGPKRGHGVRNRWIHHAFRAGAKASLTSSALAFAKAGSVIVGWCSFDMPSHEHPLTLHFAHIDALVRRRGVGLLLLRSVLALRDERAPRFTCITQAGAALLRAAERSTSDGVTRAGEAASRVVEARGL